MPLHINPAIRAREEALEAAGLQVKLDSAAVTTKKGLEAGGAFKPIPNTTYLFNNNSYTAK